MQELLKIRDTIQAEYEYHVNACDPQGMVEGLHMALILIDEHKDRLIEKHENLLEMFEYQQKENAS